jgi:orotidine-5'-phosphate decarboxylase
LLFRPLGPTVGLLPSAAVPPPFADRFVQSARRLGHPLCVGIDPHLALIPASFRAGSMLPGKPETAAAVESWCTALLDRVAERVAIVKPQSAFFEALGPPGAALLARVIEAAHARGLLVLLDAKRGDVGSTAQAYAAAYLGEAAPYASDALTLNAYLGLDSLEPFVAAAARSGAGLFVVLRSSNPGARDFQDLRVPERPLYERVAEALAARAEALAGPATGWSGLGVVVGASWPAESRRIREILPRSLFLVPGYGAQGGSARDALAGFVPGPDGRLEGGLVASSRAIGFPPDGQSGDAASWERAVDRALAAAIAELC